MKNKIIDIIKLNHWLNVRKLSLNNIKNFSIKLANKIKGKNNFYCSEKDLVFFEKVLNISKNKIILNEKLPKFIHWNKKKIESTKRKIYRDNIHFYNYYSLPSPKNFISPVILDILCPKKKIPKLNNGHLEQAITIALGKGDIYGRWGNKLNKDTFKKIKVNNLEKYKWIVGDSYVEPAYCPHSYSLSSNIPGRILSYTAKSQLQKFVENLNHWPKNSSENFLKMFKNKINLSQFIQLYSLLKGLDLNFILKRIGITKKNFLMSLDKKNNNLLLKSQIKKIQNYLGVECNLFSFNEKKEDRVGKVYCSFKKSIKSIRKYKSYSVADIAFSNRYPDLRGLYFKVTKEKNYKDLIIYANCHYLVTQGKIKMLIENKKITLNEGDAIWLAPFQNHGFEGKGSLIRISNGETIDYLDLIELSRLYNPKYTLKRLYKDKFNWGYDL
jgi:hypothetical protein